MRLLLNFAGGSFDDLLVCLTVAVLFCASWIFCCGLRFGHAACLGLTGGRLQICYLDACFKFVGFLLLTYASGVI